MVGRRVSVPTGLCRSRIMHCFTSHCRASARGMIEYFLIRSKVYPRRRGRSVAFQLRRGRVRVVQNLVNRNRSLGLCSL